MLTGRKINIIVHLSCMSSGSTTHSVGMEINVILNFFSLLHTRTTLFINSRNKIAFIQTHIMRYSSHKCLSSCHAFFPFIYDVMRV